MPGAQGALLEPLMSLIPAGQIWQVSWAGGVLPAMQSVHDEAPSWLEALPGAQSVHAGAISKSTCPCHRRHRRQRQASRCRFGGTTKTVGPEAAPVSARY